MTNKRKTTTAIVAGVTALALVLGGTFAWTSISQQARNEAIVDINPGGRLHDDFDGSNLATAGVLANKDVYVENFGDELTGVPIYARVRLDQYLELGPDAGVNVDTEDERNIEVAIGGTSWDVSTWETWKPGDTDVTDGSVSADKYFDWKLGNADEDTLPYYLPTFNMNKDSLAADINGTWQGTVDGDKVYYDDYIAYTDGQTVEGTEVYDWDTDTNEETDSTYDNNGVTTDPNTPIDSADVYEKSTNDDGSALTHTAKRISEISTVISMAQWNALSDDEKAAQGYWVYDTDGWAYWSKPIQPGETTGLLLDGVTMSRVPDENWYYGINVVGQFVTAGDLSAFNMGDETMTDAAKEMMAGISAQGAVLEISGTDTILPGTSETFSGQVLVLGTPLDEQPEISWSATDEEGYEIDAVAITEDGVLSVDSSVLAGTKIVIKATAGEYSSTKEVAVPGLMLTYNGDVYLSGDSFDLQAGVTTTSSYPNSFTFTANSASDVTWNAEFITYEGDDNPGSLTTNDKTATLNIPKDSFVSAVELTVSTETGDTAVYYITVYHELSLRIKGVASEVYYAEIGDKYSNLSFWHPDLLVGRPDEWIITNDSGVTIQTELGNENNDYDYIIWNDDVVPGTYSVTAVKNGASYVGSMVVVEANILTLTDISNAETKVEVSSYLKQLTPGIVYELSWSNDAIVRWEMTQNPDGVKFELVGDKYQLSVDESFTSTAGVYLKGYDENGTLTYGHTVRFN